jgi:hypothetical protein
MTAMFPWLWRSPEAGVRWFSLTTQAAVRHIRRRKSGVILAFGV